VLLVPTIFENNELVPIAVFYDPVVFDYNVHVPTEVFESAD
jgi:hypothetical protein